ncbi:MAG: CocE/NonD family hydrolase [Bryobacteraceae bacterium]
MKRSCCTAPSLALAIAASVAAQPVPAPAGPATLAGPGEDTTFFLHGNEDRIGTLKVKWLPDGTYRNEATLAMAGQSVTITTSIVVDKDGFWTTMSTNAPTGVATSVREGAKARRTLKEKTETFEVKPGARVFDNYGPALMSQPVRLYDRAKGGKQSFPLVVLPGAAVDASLEFRGKVERTVGGKDLTLYRYTYGLPGVDVIIWADADGRIFLGDVPAQHAAYVRDGYEALRKEPVADPLLSQRKYELKAEAGVKVGMRDGVKLSTDLYLPQTEGKVPVILIRTPYKKEMLEVQGSYYARRGYVVAVQDCRGRFGSEQAVSSSPVCRASSFPTNSPSFRLTP